jgi:hypothetical protein
MLALRTTIELPAPVMRDVKVRAAQAGVSMKVLLTQWIESALRQDSALAAAPQLEQTPIQRRPLPSFVRARRDDQPLQAGLSNAELHRLLDDADAAHMLTARPSTAPRSAPAHP